MTRRTKSLMGTETWWGAGQLVWELSGELGRLVGSWGDWWGAEGYMERIVKGCKVRAKALRLIYAVIMKGHLIYFSKIFV